MKPLIIAFTGPRGAGKDTAARMILDAHPRQKIKQIAFVDPVKRKIMEIYDLQTVEQYDAFKRTLFNMSLDGHVNHYVEGRRIVRETGMLMRSYDENQFCEAMHHNFIYNAQDVWLVTDLRFQNELDFLKSWGAKVVRIYNPTTDVLDDDHVTEQGFAKGVYDEVLANDESLAVFERRVLDLYRRLHEAHPWPQL